MGTVNSNLIHTQTILTWILASINATGSTPPPNGGRGGRGRGRDGSGGEGGGLDKGGCLLGVFVVVLWFPGEVEADMVS